MDCDEATGLIDVERAAEAVTAAHARVDRRYRPLGQPGRPRPARGALRTPTVALVEDACQAHGALYKGAASALRPLRGVQLLSGQEPRRPRRRRRGHDRRPGAGRPAPPLRELGEDPKGAHVVPSNARLDTIHAAALHVKLPHSIAGTNSGGASRRAVRRGARRRPRWPVVRGLGGSRSGTCTSCARRSATSSARRPLAEGGRRHRRSTTRRRSTSSWRCATPAALTRARSRPPRPARAKQLSLPMYAELEWAQVERVASLVKSAAAVTG